MKKSWRYWLQQLHLWSGLILCVPLVLIGLTGSALVFHHEIEEMTAQELPTPSPGIQQPAGAIVEAALAVAPRDHVPAVINFPAHDSDYATVRVTRRPAPGAANLPPGRAPGVTYLVDPASLAVMEQIPAASTALMRIFHDLHGNLMVEGRLGRQIVGWLGVVMLVLGISGVVMWWPRPGQWRQAFGVARGAKGLRLHRDLHGAVGIWGLFVFIIVSFTGVYIAFPETVGAGIRSVFPGRDLRTTANAIKVTPVEGLAPLGIDGLVALAREAAPGREIVSLMLATRSGQPVRANFVALGSAQGAPMTTIYLDPYRARVIEARDPARYTFGETILAWQRGIHEGGGLGWGWKILVFVSGFLPLLFVVTGISMWWIKRQRRAALTYGVSSSLQ